MSKLPDRTPEDPKVSVPDRLSPETRKMLEQVASTQQVSLYDRPIFLIGISLVGLIVSAGLIWFVYGPHGILNPDTPTKSHGETAVVPEAHKSL